MVSPKRKGEHFPHLYNVTNTTKTSSFNDQNEKNNKSLMNNHEYSSKYSCGHSSVNMVPERDTGPNKSAPPVNAVGSLRLPSCHGSQSGSKISGNVEGGDEHRLIAGRPHHHVSVQELRMQVSYIINCYNVFANIIPAYF